MTHYTKGIRMEIAEQVGIAELGLLSNMGSRDRECVSVVGFPNDVEEGWCLRNRLYSVHPAGKKKTCTMPGL